jgi:hypothetical protein
MSTKTFNNSTLSIPRSLKVVGIIGGVCAVAFLALVIAYLSEHTDLSLFITYLSDIRVTPVWPQIGLLSIPAP